MKMLYPAAFAIAALVTPALTATDAAAREYPWCLIDGGKGGSGSWNCGYVSFQQCMASKTGNRDMCNINPRMSYDAHQPRPTHRR